MALQCCHRVRTALYGGVSVVNDGRQDTGTGPLSAAVLMAAHSLADYCRQLEECGIDLTAATVEEEAEVSPVESGSVNGLEVPSPGALSPPLHGIASSPALSNDIHIALRTAASAGTTSVVRCLLQSGACPDSGVSRASKAPSPLYLAASNGHAGVVRELLEWGATVNIVNAKHAMPLHGAAQASGGVHGGSDPGRCSSRSCRRQQTNAPVLRCEVRLCFCPRTTA